MSSARNWIFRILTLAGAGAMLYSWFQPWWTVYVVELRENGVTIFPHGMQFSSTLQDYPQWLVGSEMPAWFWPMMWVYLGLCMAALLIGMFASDKIRLGVGKLGLSLPQVLIGGVGVSFIVFVVVFVVVLSMRLPAFYDAPLQGSIFIRMEEHEGQAQSYIDTGFQTAFWIACIAGPYLAVLGLLRNKIIGKPKLA